MLISKMTWEDIRDIQFEKSIALVPIAPLEEHGPHLPIITDCLFAEEACHLSANKLKENSNLHPYIFPLIPIGLAKETADFPGTISINEKTFIHLVQDIISNIHRWGFRYCIIVSPHASPLHLACIHTAMRLVTKQYPIKVDEPLARWVFNGHEQSYNYSLTNPNYYPDIHAGEYETSLMNQIRPDLVRTEKIPLLPPRKIKNLRTTGTWKQEGAVEGYLGNPAKANLKNGAHFIKTLETWSMAAMRLFEHSTIENKLPERIEIEVQKLLNSIKH